MKTLERKRPNAQKVFKTRSFLSLSFFRRREESTTTTTLKAKLSFVDEKDDDSSFFLRVVGTPNSLCVCLSSPRLLFFFTFKKKKTTRVRRPRVGTFYQSLQCGFAPYSGSQTRSAPKQNFEDFLFSVGKETTPAVPVPITSIYKKK